MGPSEGEESCIKSRDPFDGYRGVLDVLHVRYKSPKLSHELFLKLSHLNFGFRYPASGIPVPVSMSCPLPASGPEVKSHFRRGLTNSLIFYF